MSKVFMLFIFFVCTHYGSSSALTEADFSELGAQLISDGSENKGGINFIFPGTKWCGAGNTAENEDDLGYLEATDRCCRTHDNCPEFILVGETRYNLTNNGVLTRLQCSCDEQLRQCLRDSKAASSDAVGTLYFNVIGNKCFREDYPVTGCEQKGGLLNRKCLKYTYNTNGKKIYQWFENMY